MASPATSTGSTKLDAAVQNAKAGFKAETGAAPTGLDLYSRFALAGAVCCSITHGGLTPVDVYVNPLLIDCAKLIYNVVSRREYSLTLLHTTLV